MRSPAQYSSVAGPRRNRITGIKASVLLTSALLATIFILVAQVNPNSCSPIKPVAGNLSYAAIEGRRAKQLEGASLSARKPSASVAIIELGNPKTETRSAGSHQRRVAATSGLDRNFREYADNYPEDEINTALKQTPKELRDLFNVANTLLDNRMNLTERKALYYTDNDFNEPTEESICATATRHIYPRQALRENSLVYVPNNEHFKQVIKAEVCVDPQGECRYLQNNLPYGFISSCHQKYAYKKLLYFDELDKRTSNDLFRYPSCCSCMIQSVFNLRTSANSTTLSPTSTDIQSNPVEDRKLKPTEKPQTGSIIVKDPE